MELLKGKSVAAALMAKMQKTIKEQNLSPTLATLRVGDNPDDVAYERSILRQGEKAGVVVQSLQWEADIAEEALLAHIEELNQNPRIHGILLFRPLPDHIDETRATGAILPEKDVDGITPHSLAGVFANQSLGFPPCTAEACMELLRYYDVPLAGKKVTVLGRSLTVGRPLALMAMAENATVTLCHSKTPQGEFLSACRQADVLLVAIGKAKVVGKKHVKTGQIIVDVGINFDEDAQLCGDVDLAAVTPLVEGITPVPGGVGTVTTAILMHHVVRAAQNLATA